MKIVNRICVIKFIPGGIVLVAYIDILSPSVIEWINAVFSIFIGIFLHNPFLYIITFTERMSRTKKAKIII